MQSKDIDLTLSDFSENVKKQLGKTEWVSVFELGDPKNEIESIAYFSALISNKKVAQSLEKSDWDLLMTDGYPGFVTYFKKGKPVTRYQRFTEDGIEPFVYWRTFSGKEESYYEVSEEFRLYFNLLEKPLGDRKVFVYTNDDGDDDDAILISPRKVEVKLKYIKEFLAAKKMHLAILFEAMRFSEKSLEELKQEKVDNLEHGTDYCLLLYVRNLEMSNKKSQGWIHGKKLISGAKSFSQSMLGENKKSKYEEYIVGVDEDGNEVAASCNTDYQSIPGFLTPIFFKREVLKKYYDNPDKYSVEDAYIKREGFWSLRALNNHRDHVVIFLGDLKDIPYKEQVHWRTFNVTPEDRKISRTDYKRNIEGEFCDPEHLEFFFKQRFDEFQKKWEKYFGWKLFRALSKEDAHHLKSLHVPTTKEQKEFDDQVGSITKIVIDSLNEEELIKGLKAKVANPKGIDKLEVFLEAKKFNRPKLIEFLRKLQSLRSTGSAHRKGKNYDKIKEHFHIGEKEFQIVFEEILVDCIRVLNSLGSLIVSKDLNDQLKKS